MSNYGHVTSDVRDNSTLMEVNMNSGRLLVPSWQMPQVLSLISQLQCIEGYGSSEHATSITFSVLVAKSYIAEPISEREQALQKEADQRAAWWQEERAKVAKLEKQLNDLREEMHNESH